MSDLVSGSTVDPTVSAAAAAMGRVGGRTRGESKRRSAAHYSRLARMKKVAAAIRKKQTKVLASSVSVK